VPGGENVPVGSLVGEVAVDSGVLGGGSGLVP
jgi:hypothetical protein